jgi:hypothetical protein
MFLQEEHEHGYFMLKARHSSQCLMLDWRGGSYTNGTKIIQYPACYGYLPSLWYWGFVFNGCDPRSYDWKQQTILINAYSRKCLDAGNSAGGAPGREAVLQQWDCISSVNDWNAGNQLWTQVWAQ